MRSAGNDVKALYEKARTIHDSGRSSEALPLYDEVLQRVDAQPKGHATAGDALLGKADCLRTLKRFEEAMAVCDAFERRFGDATAPTLRQKLADAHFHKIKSLIAVERQAEALVACDKALTAIGDASTPGLRESMVRFQFEKGDVLYDMHRPAEALAVFDHLLEHLQSQNDGSFLEWILRALNAKGAALDALERREEAIAAYDDMLGREGAGHLLIADTMMSKARSLANLKRRDEAIATFDRLIDYCRENARYIMGDDYRGWALRQVGGEAVAQRKLLVP